MSNKHPHFDQGPRTIPRYALTLVRLAVGGLVIAAVARAGLRARQELDFASLDWTQVRWRWLFVAGVLYAMSQIPLAAFWRRILAALDVHVRFATALRGFVAGQLGKYVPGKMMVAIIRSSMLQLPMSSAPRAIASVFVETFTYMAVGAFLAGVGGFAFFRHERALQLVSLAAMALMVLLTNPRLIKWLVRGVLTRSAASVPDPTRGGVTYRLIGVGWLASLIAWSLSTASLCATLCAMPISGADTFRWEWDLPLRLGTSLAAAVVLGFASMLPGGLGAREYVLDRLLAPLLGEVHALTVTVLLRAIWLLTEVVASIILYLGQGQHAAGPDSRRGPFV